MFSWPRSTRPLKLPWLDWIKNAQTSRGRLKLLSMLPYQCVLRDNISNNLSRIYNPILANTKFPELQNRQYAHLGTLPRFLISHVSTKPAMCPITVCIYLTLLAASSCSVEKYGFALHARIWDSALANAQNLLGQHYHYRELASSEGIDPIHSQQRD